MLQMHIAAKTSKRSFVHPNFLDASGSTENEFGYNTGTVEVNLHVMKASRLSPTQICVGVLILWFEKI